MDNGIETIAQAKIGYVQANVDNRVVVLVNTCMHKLIDQQAADNPAYANRQGGEECITVVPGRLTLVLPSSVWACNGRSKSL